MATIDEMLAAMDEPGEDARVILTIDANLRIVSIPSVALVIGAKGDKDVNRIWFKMDRDYRGTDLSEFEPKVYYTNAAGARYYHVCTDTTVEDNSILFCWHVGRNAAEETGTVTFGICMQRSVDGVVQQEFNTTIATMQCLQSACDKDAENDAPGQEGVMVLGNAALGRIILG